MARTAESFAREAHDELWRWLQRERAKGLSDTNWEGGFDRTVAKAIRRALMSRRNPTPRSAKP